MDEIWDKVVSWTKDGFADFTLVKIYIGCAIAGGTVLIGQTGLNLFGLGGDGDIDPDIDVDDIDGGDSLSFLSIRALAGFLTFFGLIGWKGTSAEWGGGITAIAAFFAGCTVMVFVAVMMRFFKRLHSSGTLNPESAVGKTARVYLKIPGAHAGKGKITVTVQGRSVEFDAMTSGGELPTGSECRVVSMISEGIFEVAPLV